MQDIEPGIVRPATALELAVPEDSRTCSLGLWDAVSIIVGIVVGAGIYETAPMILQSAGTPTRAFGVWLLGGVLSLIGACCYAELASAYPKSGGDYVYLSRAFAPWVGFLFGWAQLAVLLTGSIGMMAYVFSDYAVMGAGLDSSFSAPLAAFAAIALTVLNLGSVTSSKGVQNVLTLLKAAGLGLVVLAGVLWGKPAALAPSSAADGPGSFGLAMILVLYTYGGWNDAAFVAREVRDRRKNLPRALILGTLIITLVYLAVNAAFVSTLGFREAAASEAIAADVLERPLGERGAVAMSVLVMVSALSAVNGLVFTGARVHSSLGRDYSALSALGRWHPRFQSPVGALIAQLVITLALIALVGTSPGREVIGVLMQAFSSEQRVTWSGHGGFDTLLRCTAPMFWAFFFLTSCALFVLRARDPHRERPFRVPLHPVLPAIFSATCLYMLYAAVDYAGPLTLIGVGIVLLGMPVYFSSRQKPTVAQLGSTDSERRDPNPPGATPMNFD